MRLEASREGDELPIHISIVSALAGELLGELYASKDAFLPANLSCILDDAVHATGDIDCVSHSHLRHAGRERTELRSMRWKVCAKVCASRWALSRSRRPRVPQNTSVGGLHTCAIGEQL